MILIRCSRSAQAYDRWDDSGVCIAPAVRRAGRMHHRGRCGRALWLPQGVSEGCASGEEDGIRFAERRSCLPRWLATIERGLPQLATQGVIRQRNLGKAGARAPANTYDGPAS